MGEEFYRRFWKTIKEKKQPFIGEVTNHRKNGKQYLAELRVLPLLDDRGRVKFFVGLQRDITEQRGYEKNLLERNAMISEQKEKTEAILRFLKSIGDGIFAVDRENRIIFMNEAAEALTRKTFADVSGQEPSQAIPFYLDQDPPVQCPCPLKMVMGEETSRSYPENVFLWGEQEKKIHLSGQASPIHDSGGAVIGAIVVFRDVTERRKLERTKDRFLSVAAHQLRTPLGSMRWNMEMILSGDFGKLPKKAVEAIKQLYVNSHRLIVIVNDLLDVARINQDKATEEATPTDILDVVRQVATTLQPEAEKYRVTVRLPALESFPNILMAKKHLYEIVENLLSNAIKYNRAGGVAEIALAKTEGILRLTITDTGIGIPREDQERIFSKFFRAGNAAIKEADGSGLGLFVVKSFVEMDGGTIRFESVEGKGTTFIIEWPVCAEKADDTIACIRPADKKPK
jgi:PAS domain S-box-containing protein